MSTLAVTMTPTVREAPVRRYGVAVAAPVAALLGRLALGDIVSESGAFIFFVPAVMLAAWYGGLGPGMVATVAGALLGDNFLVKPSGTFSQYPADLPRVMVFLLVGGQISWLGGALRAARFRAEADAEAARRSETLYRTLARNFPHAIICLFDRDLRVVVAEGAGMDEAGLTRSACEGRPLGECLPPPAARPVDRLCRDAVAWGDAVAGEAAFGGRTYFVQALPLDAAQPGSPHAGMVIMQDVTEEARAQDELRRAHDELERRVRERTAELHLQKSLLESQSEASWDAVLAASPDGRVLHANGRFREMWGLDGPPVDGPLDGVRRAMRARAVGPLDPLGDGVGGRGPGGRGEVDEVQLRGGRTVERYSAPIVGRDGGRYGRVWFFRDTTDRKRLEREIIEAGDHERQRIGQDLHDDLCQQLSGIACLARVLEGGLRTGTIDARSGADEAHRLVTLIQQATGHARDLARGLQPVRLRTDGLDAALRELCATVSGMFGVDCACGGGGFADAAVSGPAATHLYRIAQEAIHNAVRHGRARTIRVDLVAAADRVVLTVEDDGVGIPDDLPDHGLGLHTMSFRARMIGAVLTVERGSAGGTVVTCAARRLRLDAAALLRNGDTHEQQS